MPDTIPLKMFNAVLIVAALILQLPQPLSKVLLTRTRTLSVKISRHKDQAPEQTYHASTILPNTSTGSSSTSSRTSIFRTSLAQVVLSRLCARNRLLWFVFHQTQMISAHNEPSSAGYSANSAILTRILRTRSALLAPRNRP